MEAEKRETVVEVLMMSPASSTAFNVTNLISVLGDQACETGFQLEAWDLTLIEVILMVGELAWGAV